jgi:hypothetical protein
MSEYLNPEAWFISLKSQCATFNIMIEGKRGWYKAGNTPDAEQALDVVSDKEIQDVYEKLKGELSQFVHTMETRVPSNQAIHVSEARSLLQSLDSATTRFHQAKQASQARLN